MGAFGGGQTGYTAVSIIFAAGCVVAFAITFFGTREKTEYFQRTSETGEPKISLKTRIMLLARNKYFLLAVLLFLAYYGISAFSNVSVYYSQYVLGDANLMGMLSLATYIPQVIGMLFIAPILSKFGKRFCCLLGLGVSLLGYFCLLYTSTAVFVVSATLILKLGIATVALVGSILLLAGSLDILTFFLFLLVVSRLYDPLQGALQNLAAVISTRTNIARMNEILDHPVPVSYTHLDVYKRQAPAPSSRRSRSARAR